MFGLSKPSTKAQAGASQPQLGLKPDSAPAQRAQALNQAPDSIPGMFKPGEFVLPPDTVHAMGGKQALQGVVDATHTPVSGGFGLRRPPEAAAKPGPGLGLHRSMLRSADPVEAPQLGLRPKVFFANGGAPEDQIQQSGVAAKPSAAPSPSNTFPGNRLPGSSGFSSAPPSAPAAAPQPAPAGMSDSQRAEALAQIPTGGPKAPAADGSQDSWSNTEAGRNFGNAVASLPGLGGAGRVASTGGAISRSFNAASTAANNAGRAVLGTGLLGGASPAAAASADPVAPATSTAGAGRGSINPPLVNPGAAAPTVASTPSAPSNQVMEGVYNHGRGQYSDQAGGMGFSAGFTGKPSAQNNAAAGALAQSEAGGFGLKRPAQPEPGGFGLQAPTVSHSGNDWAARQRLKNLETSASSIMNTQRWGGRGAANNPAAQNFLDASRADLAAQGKEPDMQMRTNEINAGLHRAAMAEAGADRRADGQMGLGLRRLDLDQQRNQLDAKRVASDERLRAPQIRAAERLGQLQEAYINAKTPEEQAALATQMRAYSGKDEADWKVQVTPATKNLDGSTTAGSVIRYNSRTGDVQEVNGVGGKPPVPAKDSLKAGQVYQTPRGQARWNGSEFELVG